MTNMLIINCLEMIKYIMIFSFIWNGKFHKKKAKVLIGISIFLMGLFYASFILKSDDLMVSISLALILITFLYEGKIKNKAIYYVLTIMIISYIDTICYAVFGYIKKEKIWWYFIHNSQYIKIVEAISANIIILLCTLVLINKKRPWLQIEISIKQHIILALSMLSFYVVLVTMFLFSYYGKSHISYLRRVYIVFGIAIFITITCIIAFFIYSNYLKQQNDMHLENVHLYDENLGLRLSYYDQVQGNYEKVRQFRHDFRHHLAAIEGLIQGKEYSELEDYVVQLSKQDVKLKNERMRYTGNYMIDAIIVGIVANDNFKDVDFQFDGMLPTKIHIRDMDICGVLANGLENALEACMKNNDRKIVALKAGCFENIISFQIKNTYDSRLYDELSKGRFDSTKTDDGHGYGIRNMQRIVKEYNGKLEYSVDQEWVTADIYMQQKDENQPSETTNNQ